MHRAIFIQHMHDCGVIKTRVEQHNGANWHFFIHPTKQGDTQMLMDDEEICRDEAKIHCKKLGIRNLPADVFDC